MNLKSIMTVLMIITSLWGSDVFQDLSFTDAQTLSKKSELPVFVKFDANWCPVCRQMDSVTFKDKEIQEKLSEYITLKVDVDSREGRKLARKFNVQAIPTILIIDSKGEVMYLDAGYLSPEELSEIIRPKINVKKKS